MKKTLFLLTIYCFLGCTKKLDLKPSSNLVLPVTTQDFENLLDNTQIMNKTTGLGFASGDEYEIKSKSLYESLSNPITKAAYTWESDIYKGATQIEDWMVPYKQIFISNSVLDAIDEQDISSDSEKQRIKGWALFTRAYALYSLVSLFSKVYDPTTASVDKGIPLKLHSSVSEIVSRSSIKQTYDQVIKDAIEASELLQQNIIPDKKK